MFDVFIGLLHKIYDVESLIAWGGLLLICTIVFIETGLLFGFFLPGDSLLVTAGIFAAAGVLNVWWLLLLVPLCAIAGDQVNYYMGRKAGDYLYQRPDSMFFKKRHLEKTHEFYEKHGPKTIVLARFVPIVRTFAPAVAGAAKMSYRTFVTYNIVGGLFWVFATVLLGYFLGSVIPDIDKYLHLIIVVVIVISFLPFVHEYLKEKKRRSGGSVV
jgi:membrane-associated protein